MRLSQFLPDLNRKTGPLLDCNDTLIDGAVNKMFGRFVSCQPEFESNPSGRCWTITISVESENCTHSLFVRLN